MLATAGPRLSKMKLFINLEKVLQYLTQKNLCLQNGFFCGLYNIT